MHSADQIRKEFIEFFRSKGHTAVPSAPVVPQADPTLLFVNAGMNQFKDVFLGAGSRNYTRAVNSQKCIRVSGKHNDLEDVGRDTYHHTFFEMLGNWSFGDYFKREAISWAWELLTDVWGLPKDKLYVTVYVEDDEAGQLWASETDLGPDKIYRFEKDNFWEMGDVGPCGSCSEIHIDLDPGPADHKLAADPKRGINSGGDRYVELWNLVFINSERRPDGSLVALKENHVDTGMGFERLLSVLQGSNSNFETDVFLPLMDRIAELSGVDYQPGEPGLAHRVIADHARMLTFALTDGVVPSNEGRGYVLRRILRRAARFGRELGVKEPFIYSLVGTVCDMLGEAYPEIVRRSQHVTRMIKAEEVGFGATLDRGIELFEEVAQKVKSSGESMIRGEDAFKLYDTFGFPLDLTVLMAREKGLEVDQEGFAGHMQRRREQSRSEAKFSAGVDVSRWAAKFDSGTSTVFRGYTEQSLETKVLGADEQSMVLAETPFYAESGGQLADLGTIEGKGFVFRVVDVQRTGGLVIHSGEYESGSASDAASGTKVTARIDTERRQDIERNHTATHILHRMLIESLGESATQAGSLVAPDYLRFDFHHYEKLPDEILLEIEKGVNAEVRADRTVRFFEQDYEQAVAGGAMALFSEKYESTVRVVEVDGFSRELCGGTHVDATGRIGAFVITQEGSVAAGTRRIEALTGERAADYLLERSHLIGRVERNYSIPAAKLDSRIAALLEEQKALAKELEQARKASSKAGMDDMLADAAEFPGGGKLVVRKLDNADLDMLKSLGDSFREKAGSGAALFASEADGKLLFACAVTDDLAGSGKLKAGDVVGRIAKIAGGGGGGRAHLATAGGRDVSKLNEALAAFPRVVKELVKS
ncbi:MAG: alanine--tRNA ligase [Candidatus Glassbacteria bacterium]|nr:alanine--tRNA ligase [Candidatus Glassbacteria bacterium]